MATILQLIKLPDGTLKVLVEGINRCQKVKPINEKQFMKFQVNVIEPISLNASDEKNLIHFGILDSCPQTSIHLFSLSYHKYLSFPLLVK